MIERAANLEQLFAEPESVDVGPIDMIHRGHDGAVCFARKINGKFENLWALPAKGITGGIFDSLVGQIERDGYFSINGFMLSKTAKSKADPSLAMALRNGSLVRYLTAAFVDIDTYKFEDMTVGKAVGRIIELQDANAFPPATMIVRSGRGIWLLWLLCEEGNRRKPVRAWDDKTEAWTRIQGELHRRIARSFLPPDANARDVSRIMRVPGSINSTVGTRVQFWPQLDANGEPFIYGLDELAALVDVRPSKKKRKPTDKPVDPARREKGLKGKRALASKRLRLIERLATLRERFSEGTRHHAALLFAKFLRESCIDDRGTLIDENGTTVSIRRQVEAFIRDRCASGTHKVSADDVLDRDRYAKLRWSDVRMIELLQITDDEAKVIGCPTLAESRGRQEHRDKDANREERGQQRRELIAHFVGSYAKHHHGALPTLEEVKAFLSDERELTACKMTISRDWDQLILSGRLPPRRLKKAKLVDAAALLTGNA